MFINEENSKKLAIYSCEKCAFNTCNKNDYERHTQTNKHNSNVFQSKKLKKTQPTHFECDCGKIYKDNSGLWRHKKICNYEEPTINNENVILHKEPTNNEIIEIMKIQMIENQELRKLLVEQQKQMIELATNSNNITNNTNTNNNNCNNSFNLQVFLNEKCKNALNMSEFIDTIKMQLSDLENFAQDGYADGVYKIFVKGLNALDTYLRPIHCSDLKRETLFIKDNDCWTKETDEKLVLKNAIKRVAFKNIKQINEWILENPECKDPRTKKFDKYNKIVMNSMSGTTIKEQQDNIDKIVKNITKAVIIEKNALK